MPYLIHIPHHQNPYLLSDRDSSYLRYFDLWGWQIETVDPGTPGLPKTPATPGDAMLELFQESELYGIWKEGVRVRLQNEKKNAAELRDMMKANNEQEEGKGEKGKGGLRGMLGSCGKKGEKRKNIEINHLADMQRRWS
jgi:hypothetical protein